MELDTSDWVLTWERRVELEGYIDDWKDWFFECASKEIEEKRLNRIPLTAEEVNMYLWMGYQRAKFARFMQRWLGKVKAENELPGRN